MTRFAVFEPNVAATWARVRTVAEDYLDAQFRAGQMVGRTPAEAYYVRCDRTTMTQADIDSGILVVLAGVALLRPSEFDIIRVRQTTDAPLPRSP